MRAGLRRGERETHVDASHQIESRLGEAPRDDRSSEVGLTAEAH